MSDIVIRVEGLSKRYRLGGAPQPYRALRDTLAGLFTAPLRLAGSGPGRRSEPEIWALRDVSFEVRHGETLGIIGRNGAGKSTLLKILSRITRPSAGRVGVRGRVGSLLEVGTGFHPELNGRENIYLNGAILGMARAEIQRKFDEIVAFAEVEPFIDTPVKHYSSGMYTRLAFAVAAHLEPEVLVVDEVLAVGDAEFQRRCLGKMGEVAREGRTVLFVSHNMAAVERFCSRAIWLDRGGVARDERAVSALIHAYLNSGSAEQQPAEWRNPGAQFTNPWFQPLRFALVDEAGATLAMPLGRATPAWVQIEAAVETLDPALTVGYAIYDEGGQLLYWSYQTDAEEQRWPRLHRGRCVLRSRLPERLLNEGAYRLELIGGLHFRHWLFEPGRDAPMIQLQVQGQLSESPLWLQRRPGLLAPVIAWSLAE